MVLEHKRMLKVNIYRLTWSGAARIKSAVVFGGSPGAGELHAHVSTARCHHVVVQIWSAEVDVLIHPNRHVAGCHFDSRFGYNLDHYLAIR